MAPLDFEDFNLLRFLWRGRSPAIHLAVLDILNPRLAVAEALACLHAGSSAWDGRVWRILGGYHGRGVEKGVLALVWES